MTSTDFEPPEVPLNSRALVRTLKRRLLEAIETGKAADAKTYVDIIERLAKMAWLDDATPQERNAADQARNTKIMADVDIRLARFLKSKREEDAQAKKDL
jgi:hypothetical protein